MNTDAFNLAGKTAIVTGGARGIGAACAKLLTERGASIAITYARSAERAEALVDEIKAEGGSAFAIAADASDADAVKVGVTQAINRLGGHLDILVNNAGIAEHAPFGQIIPATIDVRTSKHFAFASRTYDLCKAITY